MRKKLLAFLFAGVMILQNPAFASASNNYLEIAVDESIPVLAKEIDVSSIGLAGEDIIASGTCGKNLVWSLNSTGDLLVSGSGTMKNYDGEDEEPPWEQYKSVIRTISISEGVTSVGAFAFARYQAVVNVYIADTVSVIGDSAFTYCTGIKELTLPISARICAEDYMSFVGCGNIEKIYLTKGSGGQQNFTTYAYKSCYYYGYTPWAQSSKTLKELVIEEGVTRIGNAAFYECK